MSFSLLFRGAGRTDLDVADLEFAGHVMAVYEAALVRNGQPVKAL